MNKVAMWKLFFYILFSSITLQVLCEKLVGDQICVTEESYTANVTEHYVRYATVRNYKWCLNVPPRCSFYTMKRINDTRIVERVQRRTVEICCTGFHKEGNKCISDCNLCVFGVCREEACMCSPGYVGENCDSSCPPGYWGSHCKTLCDCENQLCNPVNGDCLKSNDNSTVKYNLNESTSTDIRTFKLADISDHKPTTETNNFVKTTKEISQANNSYINSIATNEITTPTYRHEVTPDYDFTTNEVPEVISTLTPVTLQNQITTNPTQDNLQYKETTTSNNTVFQINTEDDKHSKDNFININNKYFIPVEIKYDKITKPLSQRDAKITTQPPSSQEKNYLIVDESDHERHNYSPQDSNVIKTITVSVATTISLIILAVVLLTINHSRKVHQKKKENANTKKKVEVSTVSIYATSIFHTPLPDPPTFENPSYLIPIECQSEPRNFEAHVICNINLENKPKTDCRDSIYDHPPSTGSYRAASIIEPLDLDHKPHLTQTEPVYDEIPCRGLDAIPYCNQPLSIYSNTCGRTSF